MLKNKHKASKFCQTDDLINFGELGYEKISPIKYKIRKPDKKYAIFTESFNENWKLGSQNPTKLMAVNLYEFKDDFTLRYIRFYFKIH